MARRPFELHLEFTNLCNAKCVFCPYQFQEREHEFMTDQVFKKAVADYVAIKGGSVGLTPIVGDALIDPKFLERVRYLRSHPEIDRIFVTTNAILFDKFGISDVLQSGLTTINISTSGFDEANYKKIYQSNSYRRMKNNVTALVEENARLGNKVNISIGLRTDRPLSEVMKDPDFQPILKHNPQIDFTWSFTSAGDRVTRDVLPLGMKFRKVTVKRESCVSLYNGPVVLPDGKVLGCACVAAMDATQDLFIGNILETSLLDIYTGSLMAELRNQFTTADSLNHTCKTCDMYRDLELYRTQEGRERAQVNDQRALGMVVKREDAQGIFVGG
ncbi:MAG: radical SAM protein [Gemmatales bacterium]